MVDKERASRSEPAAAGTVDLSNRTKRNLEFAKSIYHMVVDLGVTRTDLPRMSGRG